MEANGNIIRKIILNVGGKVHEVPEELITKMPHTRLGKMVLERKALQSDVDNKKNLKFFFGRPSDSFDAIVAFYFTTELHMPNNLCPMAFQKELKFWEINADTLEPCCRFKYLTFFDDYETTTGFQEYIREEEHGEYDDSGCQQCRSLIWTTLQHENSTCISEVSCSSHNSHLNNLE